MHRQLLPIWALVAFAAVKTFAGLLSAVSNLFPAARGSTFPGISAGDDGTAVATPKLTDDVGSLGGRAYARREKMVDNNTNDMIDCDRRGQGLGPISAARNVLNKTMGIAAGLAQRRTADRNVLSAA